MKKKTKLGLNTGNSFRFGPNAKFMKRHQKDQHLIIKTMENGLIQPANAVILNNRITQEVTDMVQDGEINDSITYRPNLKNFILRTDDLEYSANKRKRWEIKDKVLKSIEELRELQNHSSEGSKKDKEEPFHISLSERKFVPVSKYWSPPERPSSTEYHSSASESAYPEQKYAFLSYLIHKCRDKPQVDKRAENKKKRKIGHNQHFRDLQRKNKNFMNCSFDVNHPQHNVVEDNVDPPIPEIHYEISGPRSMIAHHKYYCVLDKWGYYGDFPSDKAWKKCKHAKNKAAYLHNGYGQKELNDFCIANCDGIIENRLYGNMECNNFEEELNEESELEVDTEIKTNYIDFTAAFEKYNRDKNNNFMFKKNRSKQNGKKVSVSQPKCGIPNVASSNNVKQHGKGTAIFEEVKALSHVEVSKQARNIGDIREWIIHPVTIQAVTLSLNPKHLESYFSDSYVEGCSKSRTFILNLSHYYLKKNKLLDPGSVHSKGGIYGDTAVMYAVFKCYGSSCFQVDHDDEEEHYDSVTRFQYVCVTIEGNLEVEEKMGIHQRLNRKFYSVLTVKDIVDIIIETLMPKYHHFFQDRTVDVKTKPRQLYSHFSTHNKWDTKVYTTETAFHVVKDLPAPSNSGKVFKPLDLLLDSMNNVENIIFDEAQMCGICYTNTDPNRHKNVTGTALLACQHWFCNDCWTEHLRVGIKNGFNSLECPAYECSSIVDHATIMSLLGYRLYEKHWIRIQNAKLESCSEFKWCPRTICDRIVQVKVPDSDPNDQLICVHCECGLTWCFDCQKEPHWPIPCKAADRYVKQTDPYNKDSNKILFVEVKKCKKCKLLFQNSFTYCWEISCRCGFTFCWECLQPWESHKRRNCPPTRVNFSTIYLEEDLTTNEQFYDKAREFRQKRQMLMKNMYLRTTHSSGRKLFLNDLHQQSLTKSAEYARNKETLKELYNYLYQVYHFLEYCFAFISQVKVKRQGVMVEDLSTLCLVTNRLEHVVQKKTILSMPDLVLEYQSLHNSSHTVMQKISMKLLKYNQVNWA